MTIEKNKLKNGGKRSTNTYIVARSWRAGFFYPGFDA